MTELQLHTKNQVLETIHVFASPDRQSKYKNSVPFVHVPRELVAQFDSYRNLRSREWYIGIWSEPELKALDDFDIRLNKCFEEIGEDMDDVPEIFEDQKWIEIVKTADECLRSLNK